MRNCSRNTGCGSRGNLLIHAIFGSVRNNRFRKFDLQDYSKTKNWTSFTMRTDAQQLCFSIAEFTYFFPLYIYGWLRFLYPKRLGTATATFSVDNQCVNFSTHEDITDNQRKKIFNINSIRLGNKSMNRFLISISVQPFAQGIAFASIT